MTAFTPLNRMKNIGQPRHQRGVTLVELMVGLFIGLMVVGIAGAALMASRGISGTVSDAADIQQQAAYAMRVIGQQARQTGSLYLNLNTNSVTGDSETETLAAVRIELTGNTDDVVSGDDSELNISYTRYTEPTFTGPDPISHARNCVGAPSETGANSDDESIENNFSISDTNLLCGGNGATAQPIIGNVRDFQVRYLVQDKSNLGNPSIAYLAADDVSDWDDVQGIEVCLVLFGDERIDIPADSSYKGCDGSDKAYTDNKMHLLFRNVFQLRSQGLMRG